MIEVLFVVIGLIVLGVIGTLCFIARCLGNLGNAIEQGEE